MTLRILVPLDGSQRSEQSLVAAGEIAAVAAAEVFLLRVVPPAPSMAQVNPAFEPSLWDDSGRRTLTEASAPMMEIETAVQATEREKAEAEDYLALSADRFSNATVHCLVHVAERPADEILTCAEACQVHLIVMAGHGRHPLARVLLSSTTEHVVRSGRFPVVLVPPAH